MKSGPCTSVVFKLHFASRKTPVIMEILGVIVLPGAMFADTGFGDFDSVEVPYGVADAHAEATATMIEAGF